MIGWIANAYSLTGRLQEAVASFQDVVSARKKIITLDPSDGSQKGRLTVSLAQLSKTQSDLGETTSALSNAEEASNLCAELIRNDPSNTNYEGRLQAINLGMIATIRDMQGDLTNSTSAVEEMVNFTDELSIADPSSALKSMEAFAARVLLSIKYRQQGKPTSSIETLNRLQPSADAHKDTTDVIWFTLLVNFYHQKFNSTIDVDANAGLGSATDLLAVSRRWSELDKQNLTATQYVGTAYTCLGIASRLLKRLDDARIALLEGLNIRRSLVEREKANFQYKSDLAISWSQLNAVLWEQADYSGALEAEQSALLLRRELAALDTKNLELQADIAGSYSDIASALERLDRRPEAREALEMALNIRQLLVRSQPNRADYAETAGSAMDRLARFNAKHTGAPALR